MLIDENSLDIACSQGHPGDEEWVAKASVAADLTPVMPYINAVVKRPEYYPDVPAVIWPYEDRQVAVRPHEIAVNHVPDSEAAAEEIRRVVAWINDLWEGKTAPRRCGRLAWPRSARSNHSRSDSAGCGQGAFGALREIGRVYSSYRQNARHGSCPCVEDSEQQVDRFQVRGKPLAL